MEQGGGQIEEDPDLETGIPRSRKRGCAQPGPRQGGEAAGLSEARL